jgi:hypothetical protein
LHGVHKYRSQVVMSSEAPRQYFGSKYYVHSVRSRSAAFGFLGLRWYSPQDVINSVPTSAAHRSISKVTSSHQRATANLAMLRAATAQIWLKIRCQQSSSATAEKHDSFRNAIRAPLLQDVINSVAPAAKSWFEVLSFTGAESKGQRPVSTTFASTDSKMSLTA